MGEEMDVSRFVPSELRVLAVDDDCTGLRVLKAQLKHCNYHNVKTATDAATALDMLRERKGRDDQFDLVISDIFMADGGIDGFKLLEHISLEMDIPVILISANDEKKTMVKGVMHGACDYIVKPARLEQIRNIWLHVIRKSVNDQRNKISGSIDAAGAQKLPEDAENGECANHTRKHSKNKKDSNGAEEDKEGTSTQKKPRVQWSGELHRKFLEAIDQIGLDNAVPKKIHEVMNVDGLGRDSVGSHLQKYRIYLKKLNEGTLRHSDPFVDEQQAWLSGTVPANGSMSVPAQHQNSKGTCVLPTQSDQHMSAQRNLGIPLQQDTRSCTSYASVLRRKMLDANRGIPFDDDNLFEEIANGEMSAPSSHLSLQAPESANQPSVQIQSSSAGQFNQVPPSSHLPLQSPELVNQPSIQIMSSAGLFNPVVEPHQLAGLSNSSSSWGTGVLSRFPDIGHIAGTSIGPTNGNNISGLVASSSQVPTFGNEYQNQMAGIMGTTAPMIGFSEQVPPLFGSGSGASSTMMPIGNTTLGSSSSINQIGNYVMPTQMLNGGGATGNLHEDGTVDQHYVGDQVTNNNELLAGTSETQNAAIDDMDGFLADWMFS
ncbi:unnamed protein product [Urochloa decumbens]|uniref:Two-component response regulator n=1 Tax=Urochloa decumbens TaxID=240449 RepID=A0ABC9DND4_9POAL